MIAAVGMEPAMRRAHARQSKRCCVAYHFPLVIFLFTIIEMMHEVGAVVCWL
jgi:hypothetical protein